MSEIQLKRAEQIVDYLVDECDAEISVMDLLDALATYGYSLSLSRKVNQTTDSFNAYLMSLTPGVSFE